MMVCAAAGCGGTDGGEVAPPRARIEPMELEAHGATRVDEYYWLRDRDDPEVVGYLAAENAYLEQAMAHTADLQETLFQEIVGRIKDDDESVPYRFRDYYYQARYEDGKEYPIHVRRPGAADAPEQVMVDVNELAAVFE